LDQSPLLFGNAEPAILVSRAAIKILLDILQDRRLQASCQHRLAPRLELFCNRAARVKGSKLALAPRVVVWQGPLFCPWSARGRHMMRSDGADEPI
jgi:hypothetical protein